MSDEEEEVEEEEQEEEEQQEEQKPQKQENDELNEFRKYNPHSSYANMHKYPKNHNDHNPLAYYYQRQLPIPYQPSQYWMERVQYHQKEIDRAKQVLLNVQKPQPNMYNYERSLNYQPNNSPLPQKVQIESQKSLIPPYQQPSYNFEPRDFNRSNQAQVQPPYPYNFNPQSSKYNSYPPPPLQSYQPPPQQNYYPHPQYDLQNSQFSGNPTINSQYQPYSPYQNYYPPPPPFAYVPPPYDFQQDLMNEYPKVNLQNSKQVQTEKIQDLPQLPTGISQFQQEKPQPFSQQNIAPTQPLSETELEYIEFLRFKEFNQKQQQQIDDQDFQEFQEFRKLKQQQLFKQTVDREEEKRSLGDLYKRKNRQVYSEQEYKSQLDKKRDYQQFHQPYTKPLQQETNLEIDRAINALMRSQTGTNKDFFK
ncbi:unnamed protein product [Paramecium pentaurelia]|uniref:Uncharacterized protein n=1 Tax=Paramecium pentaurelia TaxID=43138 RepID=A0A8S1UFL9_9CILI|nr:unnamed protein product [Paramecium pentaurelia]